jgi:MFS family permease
MGVLALGGVTAANATTLMAGSPLAGVIVAVLAFSMIGAGVGAAGTSLLALLATQVAPQRRPAAAAITWIMMIVGIVVTAGVAGAMLDPFSYQRLATVAGFIALAAFSVTLLAVAGVEGPAVAAPAPSAEPAPTFTAVLRETWADQKARRFAVFVFVSMLAYSAQDLILEPFAGLVFNMTPGQSTQLSGVQHGGVLLGMILVGVAGGAVSRRAGWMRGWTIAGCAGSALALLALAMAAKTGPGWPLQPTVFLLGLANGVFAVAAIGSMMGLAGDGAPGREGMRMGVWGAAQPSPSPLAVSRSRGRRRRPPRLRGRGAPPLWSSSCWRPPCSSPRLSSQRGSARPPRPHRPRDPYSESAMSRPEEFDVVVVGGGPSGATAARELAAAGRSVMLLDRDGRIKPCGGAIPPRLIRDFDIPDQLICAKANAARMIAPSDRRVEMPINGGYVGMVNRETFDEWLRERAVKAGAGRRSGVFERIEREAVGEPTSPTARPAPQG